MNRLNNPWPFNVANPPSQAMLNQFKQTQQLLLLQQQIQQQQQHNFDPNLLSLQLQQHALANNNLQFANPSANNKAENRFNSAFSVNSLLNSQPIMQLGQDKLGNMAPNFASLLSQQLASAVANYRNQNQQRFAENNSINAHSAFHQPPQKRAKLGDHSSNNSSSYDAANLSDPEQILTSQNQMNTSISSISSPSSSTSSTTAASISIDYTGHHLDYLTRIGGGLANMANRCSQLDSINTASSSSSVSSASLNESDYSVNQNNHHNNNNNSERVTPEMLVSTPSSTSYYSSYFKNLSSNFICLFIKAIRSEFCIYFTQPLIIYSYSLRSVFSFFVTFQG
jgi:hypothetical protein